MSYIWIQKNIIRVTFFALFTQFSLIPFASATNVSSHCDPLENEVKNKTLFINGDVEIAEKLLIDNKNCAKTNYHKAIYSDLSAEIYRFLYLKNHLDNDFKLAMTNYNEALTHKTKHTEYVLWHMSLILTEAKKYKYASKYINKLFEIGSDENMHLYMGTALEISVLTKDWETAQKLVNLLFNTKKGYHYNIGLLTPTVLTLCHYDKKDVAEKFILSAKKARPNIVDNGNFKALINLFNDCDNI